MPLGVARTTQRVSATKFRDHVKDYLRKAKGDSVVLVENRRWEPKYIVDKEWFDDLMQSVKSTMATLEILSTTIDEDLRAGRLHTLDEVFGNE